MAYSDDINRKDQALAVYLKFAGVTTKLANVSSWPSSSSVHACLPDIPDTTESRLDRARSIVMPGAMSAQLIDTPTVRTLLGRRGGTQAQLTQSISATATTVYLDDTTLASTTIYVDQETITLGTHAGSGQYTSCTRAVSGSLGATHIAGAIASTVPRHWLGRRAGLYVVATRTGNEAEVVSGELRGSPVYRDGVYDLPFVEPQSLLMRRLCDGWAGTKARFYSRTGTTVTLSVDDAREFSTAVDSVVLCTFDGGSWLVFLDKDNVDRGNNRITLTYDRSAVAPEVYVLQGDPVPFSGHTDTDGASVGRFSDMTIRTVAFFKADPAVAALRVLLSEFGDGTNSATYDVLPGVPANVATTTVDMVDKRIGAGIPAALVDVASFEAMIGQKPEAYFPIMGPRTVAEFMTEEILYRLGGYLRIKDGKISFKEYDPALPSSTIATYTENDWIRGTKTVVDDEAEVIGSAEVEHDYDIINDEFGAKTQVTWPVSHKTWPDGRPQIRLRTQSLVIEGHRTYDLDRVRWNKDQLVVMLDRIYSRTRNGVRRITLAFPWQYSEDLEVGDRFKLTDTDVPNGEGGLGFTARTYEITGRRVNVKEARIEVQAEEVPPGFLIAPSAFAAGVLSAGQVTFSTSGGNGDVGTTTPARYFMVGATVEIFDATDNFATSETKTISSIDSDTQLTIASDTTFGVAIGDLFVLKFGADTGNTSDATFADVQDHLFLANAAAPPKLDSGGGNERKAMEWT